MAVHRRPSAQDARLRCPWSRGPALPTSAQRAVQRPEIGKYRVDLLPEHAVQPHQLVKQCTPRRIAVPVRAVTRDDTGPVPAHDVRAEHHQIAWLLLSWVSPSCLGAKADDGFSHDPRGRVEGGDGIVEGRDLADVCPHSSVSQSLGDLS